MKENNFPTPLSFKDFYLLYQNLQEQIRSLEKRTIKLFDIWYSKSIKSDNFENLLVREANEEKDFQNGKVYKRDLDKDNSLRFYVPFNNDEFRSIPLGNIPAFLKSHDINLKINMPLSENDKQYSIAEQQYNDLSDEAKVGEEIKILKELAITYARLVNIHNRYKEEKKRCIR